MRALIPRLGQLKTASVVAFSHFFVAVATLAQSIILARMLPLEEFGALAAAIAIAVLSESAINARAAETGLAAFGERSDARKDDRQALAAELFRIDLAWNACAYTLFISGIALYDWWTGHTSLLLYGVAAGGLLGFPWGTTKAYITIYLSARKFAPVEISYAATLTVVGLALASLFGPLGFILGMVAASVVRTVAGLLVSKLDLAAILRTDSRSPTLERKTIWWLGFTGTIRSALVNGLAQVDVLLLAAFASPSAVGIYRAAKTVSSIPQRLGQPVWVLLKRHIIREAQQRTSPAKRDPVAITALALLLMGGVAMPAIIVYADEGMAMLFGPEFASGGVVLWWLLPAAWVMYGVTGWSSVFGSVSKKRVFVIAIYLVQLATIAAIVLSAGVDIVSMAIAVAVSQLVAAGAFWWLYLREPGLQSTASPSADPLDDENEVGSVELL